MTLISKRRILGGLGAATLIGASVGLTMSSNAALEAPLDDHEIRVGTFEPQAAFERYHRAEEMSQQMQELQMQMQQAQQEGDQQRMMELQQQMQQMQNEVIEQFYEDLDRTMPQVAEDAQVQIVAVDVVYTDPSIGDARDLTSEVIAQLNGGEDDDMLDEPAPGGAPW